MAKRKKNNFGFALMLFIMGFVGLLYISNPSTQNLRDLMKMQNRLPTSIASYLPIDRTDYKLFSKFEIKYGIGKKTCYGGLRFVIICPDGDKNAKSNWWIYQ